MAKKQMHIRTCRACGEDHETSRAKATRCKPCIADGRKAKTRTCAACDKPYPAAHGNHFCRSCHSNPKAVSDYEVRLIAMEKEERRLRSKAKRKEMADRQLADLDLLSKKPKGYPSMTKAIAESAIGILWLNLCGTDGSVNPLLKDREVDDETKRRMLNTYLRLRLKGYTTEAVAQIDPVALMARDEAEIDQGLYELPEVVDEEIEEEDWSLDPFEDLDPEMKAEVFAFQQKQEQNRMAQCLGLAT